MKNVVKVNKQSYFVNDNSLNSKIKLHLFMDARVNAHAGGLEISFVSSKMKVAALRPISIRRMELLAAIFGSRLAKNIMNSRDIRIDSTWY